MPTPKLELETTAYTFDQLMHNDAPQLALAGRSNVGKSSLVNALAQRRKLAKVSATPGKTRSINYYRVSPWNFFLVDLPGYGYAKANHAEREKWGKLLERYLKECSSLLAATKAALKELTEVTDTAGTKAEGRERAVYIKDIVVPAMEALRQPVDRLEMLVAKDMWPMPSYGDLLFEV